MGGANTWWPSSDTARLSDDQLIPRSRKKEPRLAPLPSATTSPDPSPRIQRLLQRRMERKKERITGLRNKIKSDPKMRLFFKALENWSFPTTRINQRAKRQAEWSKEELVAANMTVVDLQYALAQLLLQRNRIRRMKRLMQEQFPGSVAFHRAAESKKMEEARLLARDLLALRGKTA